MEPLTVTIAGTRQMLGLGNTKLYELINEGLLDTIKLGRRTLVTVSSIKQLVTKQLERQETKAGRCFDAPPRAAAPNKKAER